MRRQIMSTMCNDENKQLILMGDINSDYTKTSLEAHTPKLQFISHIYQLKQLIKEPTRVTKTLFTWSEGPRSSGVVFFCFVSPRA